MNEALFKNIIITIAAGFTLIFIFVVIPPLIDNPDIIGAFAAGFVNPYSSGYSADVIACWMILVVWIVYEAGKYSIKGGWICILLGMVPGVAVGFAGYLLLRLKHQRQISE